MMLFKGLDGEDPMFDMNWPLNAWKSIFTYIQYGMSVITAPKMRDKASFNFKVIFKFLKSILHLPIINKIETIPIRPLGWDNKDNVAENPELR